MFLESLLVKGVGEKQHWLGGDFGGLKNGRKESGRETNIGKFGKRMLSA